MSLVKKYLVEHELQQFEAYGSLDQGDRMKRAAKPKTAFKVTAEHPDTDAATH